MSLAEQIAQKTGAVDRVSNMISNSRDEYFTDWKDKAQNAFSKKVAEYGANLQAETQKRIADITEGTSVIADSPIVYSMTKGAYNVLPENLTRGFDEQVFKQYAKIRPKAAQKDLEKAKKSRLERGEEDDEENNEVEEPKEPENETIEPKAETKIVEKPQFQEPVEEPVIPGETEMVNFASGGGSVATPPTEPPPGEAPNVISQERFDLMNRLDEDINPQQAETAGQVAEEGAQEAAKPIGERISIFGDKEPIMKSKAIPVEDEIKEQTEKAVGETAEKETGETAGETAGEIAGEAAGEAAGAAGEAAAGFEAADLALASTGIGAPLSGAIAAAGAVGYGIYDIFHHHKKPPKVPKAANIPPPITSRYNIGASIIPASSSIQTAKASYGF